MVRTWQKKDIMLQKKTYGEVAALKFSSQAGRNSPISLVYLAHFTIII